MVKFLRENMNSLQDGSSDFSFSDLKRAFGTLVMQGDDAYEGLSDVKSINSREAGVRGVANHIPRNESHHGTGLKIVTNPVIPAIRKQGNQWLADFLGYLEEAGYQGYGKNGEGFTSLERGQHIDIGHQGDPFTAFMSQVLDENISPREAADRLMPLLDDQVASSIRAQENQFTARARRLADEWTGIDSVSNPGGAKKALADIQKKFGLSINPEVDRQLGPSGRTNSLLSQPLQRQLMTPSGRRSFVRSGVPYQMFNNPSYYMQGIGAASGLLMDPKAVDQMMDGDIVGGLQTGGKNMLYGEALSQGLQYGAKRLGPKAVSLLSKGGAVLGPAATLTGGTVIADQVMRKATGKGYVENITQVRDKKRTAQINQQSQKTTQQLTQQRQETGQDQSAPDQATEFINNAALTINKVIQDPGNEIEYLGKQFQGAAQNALRWLGIGK